MQFPDTQILIFARPPLPGQAKTRLSPLLGEAGTAAFHAACVEHAVQRFHAAGLAPLQLCAADQSDHPLFVRLSHQYQMPVLEQQGADLGERMARAARQALETAHSVILIGTDSPTLPPRTLRLAIEQLQQGAEVTMAPAEDGGYVLLGLREAHPALFSDMPWGSEQVAQITRARCREAGLRLEALPSCADIDHPHDLLAVLPEGQRGEVLAGLDAPAWLALLRSL